MKKILTAAAVLAALTAAPAFAQSKTASTNVSVTVAQDCEITAASSSITLTTVGANNPGVFQYKCNFVGNPTLNIVSANGGVLNTSNGGALADYGVYINDAAPGGGPSTWAQASTMIGGGQTYGPGSGFLTSTTANATNSPYFSVGLTQPVNVAGTYNDTLTFTIAP